MSRSGSVLLEVVLALTLFVAAATVITSGLNTSVREVERLRLNLRASNFAVSVLSEIRLGIKSPIPANPEPFLAPYEMWTWQIQVTSIETAAGTNSPLQRIEVIVRHQDGLIVRRLSQLIPPTLTETVDAMDTEPSPVRRTGSLDEPQE